MNNLVLVFYSCVHDSRNEERGKSLHVPHTLYTYLVFTLGKVAQNDHYCVVYIKIQDSRFKIQDVFYCHMHNNDRAVAGNEILKSWAPPIVQ